MDTVKRPEGSTLKEWLDWGKEQLKERPLRTPQLDAEVLFMKAFDLERITLHVYPEKKLPIEKIPVFISYIKRRKKEEPLQYITGEKEFMGLRFMVEKGVLIPRNDTEILVEEAIRRLQTKEKAKVLEIGVGSGAISVSLLVHLKGKIKDLRVIATDIEDIPLKVALLNAEEHKVEGALYLLKGDLFRPVPAKEKFDMILSNPPYIPYKQKKELDKEVRDFEPETALFAPDHGLKYYKDIAKESRQFLKEKGCLMVEVGHDQGTDVAQILKLEGFREVKILNDLENRHRVVLGES